MSVVPAPMSATATPSSRSVSESTASPEASESTTSSSTRTPAWRTHLVRFWSAVALPWHDVRLDLEPDRAHAERVLDALLAVDHEAARQDVEHLAVGRDRHGAGHLGGAVDVLAADLALRPADGHRAARVLALDVVAADAHEGRLEAHARQALGLLHRRLDRGHGLLDVDDDTLASGRWPARSPCR